MIVQKLDIETGYITAAFDYTEVRDMANGLYHICQEKPEYKSVKDKCKFLFDLLKEGMIRPETINSMSKDINWDESEDEE